MTNKEIRRRAWELCRANFGTILGASFLISLISSLMINITYLLGESILSSFLSIGFVILNAIMTLGMVRFILNIWHGQPAPLSLLFSQKHRLGTSILCGLLIILLSVGIMIAAFIPSSVCLAVSETFGIIMTVVTTIVMLFLIIWIGLRFEMTTACIVLRPSLGATDCMRTAWRASKGKVGRLFCNAFVLNLPLFIAQALLMGYQIFLGIRGQSLNLFGALMLDIASMLISSLLTGYIALGTYALHEQLLDDYAPIEPESIELPAAEETSEEDSISL